ARTVVDDVQVGGVLLVHGPGHRRVPVQQRGAVERREQPLVRVHDERVGMLDTVVASPDTRREQAGPAVGTVHVEPQLVLAGHLGHAGQVVDDARVRGPRRGHHRGHRARIPAIRQRRPQPRTGQPMILGPNDQRLHLADPQRVGDRGMRVLTDRHPPPPPGTGNTRARLPLGHLARDNQGGQVPGRTSGDEAAARRLRHPGPVGDQPQHLVLGVDRAGCLQPGDALDRRARDQHVEQQRRLGRCGRDEPEEARAVRRDDGGRHHRRPDAEHLVGGVRFGTGQPRKRRVELGRIPGPLIQRDRVQPQPVLRVGEHRPDHRLRCRIHTVHGRKRMACAAGAARTKILAEQPAISQDDLVTNSHPLDPLSADEIRQAAAILRHDRKIGDGWRFASIELKEPSKDVLPQLETGGQPGAREAIVVCWDRADGQARRAIVSLTGDNVTSWEDLPGQQPNMTVDEWHECDEMLRAHPALAEALARRGITDMSLVLTDMWAYGAALVPDRYQGQRIGWSDVWYRGSELGNPYAHHVTGLHPVVDLNTMTLLELEHSEPGDQPPDVMGEYLPSLLPMRLREVTPLHITQPEGVGFTLDGHLLSWQNWQLRLGFNHREGLVLNQVAVRDGQRWRSVAHRLSFAEMVVPYRDASPDHYRRTAFDIGEWGLGFMTTSLSLGCDCLGDISYLDAVVHDSRGEPRTIPNAICVHEEDSGVGWKHVDERAGVEVRRARRLVISFHVTVANYEYLVYWRFYQDGNIECEVRATGILVTSHTDAPGSRP